MIYGSPVLEVRGLLIKAVLENDRVLKTPEPFVFFQDFGDDALVFDVFFWIRVNTTIERRTIESSLRFRIGDLCREAGLVIAFPLFIQLYRSLQPSRKHNPHGAF